MKKPKLTNFQNYYEQDKTVFNEQVDNKITRISRDQHYGQEFDIYTGHPIGNDRRHMQACENNNQCQYGCCHFNTFKKRPSIYLLQNVQESFDQIQLVQISVCDKKEFCEQNQVALYAVITVFFWVTFILFVSMCREQHTKNKIREEVIQEHAKQMQQLALLDYQNQLFENKVGPLNQSYGYIDQYSTGFQVNKPKGFAEDKKSLQQKEAAIQFYQQMQANPEQFENQGNMNGVTSLFSQGYLSDIGSSHNFQKSFSMPHFQSLGIRREPSDINIENRSIRSLEKSLTKEKIGKMKLKKKNSFDQESSSDTFQE